MSLLEESRIFYRERIPEQFNRTLENQRAAASGDPAAARMLEEMEAVRTAIVVQIDSGDTLHRHAFEIDRGVMRYVETPERLPFLILGHSLEDFPDIRRECGDSLLGFLGGLAGLGDEMRLTSQRVRSLRELNGSLVFERAPNPNRARRSAWTKRSTRNFARANSIPRRPSWVDRSKSRGIWKWLSGSRSQRCPPTNLVGLAP